MLKTKNSISKYLLYFVFFLFFSFMTLSSKNAYAFLENATHGYTNCLTCHYSPSGGDLLNDYGRSLSSELMSTWKLADGVEQSFGGLFKESEWARVGGDFRSLQRYLDTPQINDRALFVMQNNVEIGLKHKGLMLVGTLGSQEGPKSIENHREFISERHFVLANLTETSRLRLGKFRVDYGLNDPNHNRMVKRNLNFGSYSERYNVEYTQFFENFEILANYSFGRIDLSRTLRDERSGLFKFTHYLNGNSRLSFNYLYGESPSFSRSLVGLSGVSALSEKMYIVYELDYENLNVLENPNSFADSADRLITHTRLGYKFFKGFRAYGIFDINQNVDISSDFTKAPGLGLQWLPVPHVNLQIEYQNIDIKNDPNKSHFGFIMAQVYY